MVSIDHHTIPGLASRGEISRDNPSPTASRELLRIARERILIVVPRQRYDHFTLDEHLNFFRQHETLTRHFKGHGVEASLLAGDWAIAITKKSAA